MNPMSATVRAIFYTLALISFALALHPKARVLNLVALGLFFWVLTLAWDSWAIVMAKLAPYRKTITALVTGIIGWAAAVLASGDSGISGTEWIMLATIVATALGVYGIPNTPPNG